MSHCGVPHRGSRGRPTEHRDTVGPFPGSLGGNLSWGGAGVSGGGGGRTGGRMCWLLWNGGCRRLAGGMGCMMGERERLAGSSAWGGG